MLGVYTIVEAADNGWGSAQTLGLGALAVVLLVGFVARQATAAKPLMPLRMFRSRNVTGANLIQVLMVGGLFGMFVLGALYMQRVLGYDAVETGLAFLPVSVGIGVLSVGLAPRLTMRFGARAVLIPSLALLMAGLALFSRVPVDGDYVADILPTMVLFGIGAGMSFPALMTLAMSAPRRATPGSPPAS